jgi:hypothetical protein
MKKNIGSTDRLIRVIIGLVIALLGLIFNSWWGLLGVVLMATGLFKFCLLYELFKISTIKKDNKQ